MPCVPEPVKRNIWTETLVVTILFPELVLPSPVGGKRRRPHRAGAGAGGPGLPAWPWAVRGGHGGSAAQRLPGPSRSLAGTGGAWLQSRLRHLRRKTCELVGFDPGEVTERPFLPCCTLHVPPPPLRPPCFIAARRENKYIHSEKSVREGRGKPGPAVPREWRQSPPRGSFLFEGYLRMPRSRLLIPTRAGERGSGRGGRGTGRAGNGVRAPRVFPRSVSGPSSHSPPSPHTHHPTSRLSFSGEATFPRHCPEKTWVSARVCSRGAANSPFQVQSSLRSTGGDVPPKTVVLPDLAGQLFISTI